MANLVDFYLTESNKLDGTNYVNWKFKMQTLMEGHNIWAIVNGKQDKPTSPTTTLGVVQDWKKRELKAKILLRMSIKDSIIPHIRDITTSSGTWSALKGLYEITNSNRIFFLKRILLSIKWKQMKVLLNFYQELRN